MIHQNLAFGNLITTNYLDRLIKQQRILLKTPKEKQDKKLKPRKLFRSISFKLEQHALLLQTPLNKQKKSQMHLLLPIEKNTLKRLPSKPAPLDAMGKSEKSITSIQGRSSTQRRSSTPVIKIIRRWSEHEIQSEKLKHLNNKAPKSFIQQHLVAKAQAKKKKLNRLKMQYKFLSRLKKNQQKKLRSKTLPLPKQIKITYTRAKTIVDEQNQGPIFPIDDRLNGRINHLIMLKRGVMRRQTCFQMPKKSVLVSKEKLIRYQKQISDQMVKTQEGDSQMDISPNFDSTRVYQRRVNFSDRKESFKTTQKKKRKLLGSLLKKSSHSIITSYISNKGVTLNSEHVQSNFKPLQELLVKKQVTTEKSQLQQISTDRSNYKKRPNLLIKLQPYLQRQVIVK